MSCPIVPYSHSASNKSLAFCCIRVKVDLKLGAL